MATPSTESCGEQPGFPLAEKESEASVVLMGDAKAYIHTWSFFTVGFLI